MTPNVVTVWYRAPELLLGSRRYTTAIDLWAVGCMFGELLLNKPLLPGKTELMQLTLIYELLGTPNDHIWPGFTKLPNAQLLVPPALPSSRCHRLQKELRPKTSEWGFDLLCKLLTYNPAIRTTARGALKHPFFTTPPLARTVDQMPTFTGAMKNGRRRLREDRNRG
eukprot:TRINITY_DN4737_c0_g1_i1.p1 TRINITY_DN4737_c0_g1~~TRINITY_DN4737_c0_g1_i1.p1  ORF type:complete len:185 (+),score=16.79 TRINITY_DN4737_c0_g1_i1:55-555(+)